MRSSDAVLVLGATMRLTRLVVTDDLGQWWIKGPVERKALAAAHSQGAIPRWAKYAAGLNCPFCVGFWIGLGVLASYSVAGDTRAWRFVASGLTLNEVAAHLGARLGDTDSDPEEY